MADRKSSVLRLFRFAVVGSLGFLWDTGTVYGLRDFIGLNAATLAAYFVAASLNWAINRFWTFGDVGRHDHPVLQWLRFLSANSLGFLLNRGTVYVLFFLSPFCVHHPVVALAAGALAGMTANFKLSERLVFRERPPKSVMDLAEISAGMADAELPQCPDDESPSSCHHS
ncbi:GtrA family protein [Acetobacter sp.]|uniref:GtrA family protein n=1 Tax=Acetobacter sp. TaxID=440 RepID=UPI0025C3CAE1|nr:GtrA family protein [Acetobacter sp.]MCH4090283.1 GtrA family protein [Acetobacter sp.]MCI1298977.1 GtrA family protein [Acetobacter sp.]MCI1314997.1 GtrA family protein [Acetobacter sp.]